MVVVAALATSATCVDAASGSTGVQGTVQVSPVRPGPQRMDEPAAAPLAGATLELLRADGSVAARAVSDGSGRFKLLVPAGIYRLAAHVDEAVLPRCPQLDVKVDEAEFTRVDVACDSGMR